LAATRLALCAGLAATAGLAFHRVVPYGPLLPVVAVAAGVPAVLSGVLTGWRQLPLAAGFAVSAVAWLVMTSVTVLHEPPTVSAVRALWQGLTTGWRQALGTVLPMGPDPRVLVSVSALVWLACLLAAEPALRGRSALLPVLAPAAVFVLALLAGATGPGSDVPEAVAIVVLAGLFMLSAGQAATLAGGRAGSGARLGSGSGTRLGSGSGARPGVRPTAADGSSPSRRRSALRLAGGLAVVGIAAAAAGLGGPRLAYAHARTPVAPRLPPPAAPASAASPLDEVSAWSAAPGTVLFSVRMSVPQNLRLAVLDRFDGKDWTSDAGYLPTGSRVPPLPGARTASVPVTQRITIEALSTVWLPGVARPAAVTGTTADVDPANGQLLAASGTRPGLSYQVVSQVPQYSVTQLRDAVPANDATAQAALSLPPGAPAIIGPSAQQATAGAGFPYQQAARLAVWLRSRFRYVPGAPPGHTYGHIAYFLATSHQGTSEQFAVAYALMARSLGLPSRVVVGFRPGTARPGGVRVITGADVLVWPEVDFQGLGWMPFYPTPGTAALGNTGQVLGAGESAQRQRVDRSLAAAPLPSPVQRAAAPPRHSVAAARGHGWLTWLLMIPALIAAMLIGYLLLAILLPWRRAAALRAAAASGPGGAANVARAVAGAWLETVRRMRAAGLADVTSRTCSEVAAFGADRLGDAAGAHLSRLAALADGCEFGQLPLDPSAARAAWQHHDAVRAAVRGNVPVLTVARHRLSPGIVFGRWPG
jgi:transglutaminase-like putative cysteine protease